MITVYPYETLGRGHFGWLDARYHFSFGDYRDETRMGFGNLRVINDDIVKAGAGFDPHPHKNMEIITYVRSGAISHRDSLGHEGRTATGNVQVMSAGSGITHAEYNSEKTDTTLYQIWIHPRERNIPPRWDQANFPETAATHRLPLLVSGYAEDGDKGALYIHADAAIYGGRLHAGTSIDQPIRGMGYVLISHGTAQIEGQTLKAGDGAEITGTNLIGIKALTDAEILVVEPSP